MKAGAKAALATPKHAHLCDGQHSGQPVQHPRRQRWGAQLQAVQSAGGCGAAACPRLALAQDLQTTLLAWNSVG